MSTPSLARKPGSCTKENWWIKDVYRLHRLNKHCPKDLFPLPHIDQVVYSTVGGVLLCFLDCYSGYHQIALHLDDEDKTAFIMPHGIYCYKVMTFGLKNTAATYQKAIQKCLKT
jgi:hypothetical protein